MSEYRIVKEPSSGGGFRFIIERKVWWWWEWAVGSMFSSEEAAKEGIETYRLGRSVVPEESS